MSKGNLKSKSGIKEDVILKLIREVIESIAGAHAVGIVSLLYGKKNINEFLIAKKLKLNINQTRNILYKLSDEGLVSFIRKKDKKNGGWYTYYWTLDSGKSLENLKGSLGKDISQIELQIGDRSKRRFYYCTNCDIELDEESALLNNFTCQECGEVLGLRDNNSLIEKLKETLKQRMKLLESVNGQLSEVQLKETHARGRRHKAVEKQKKMVRAKAAALRAKVRKKDAKKSKKKRK